ncbi:MAG: histidine kinase [Bacteroidetes bacterium]|nr:histidine kinase [Bacteroidota bacterium]
MSKFLTILFLISTSSVESYSQKWQFPYSNFTKIDGFPSNTTYTSIFDLKGNLWVGTDAGLVRFNGNRLATFNTSNGLPNDEVFELFCDSKNRIWATTMGAQISYVNHNVVHNMVNDATLAKIQISKKVIDVFEDNRSRIWVIGFPFTINIIDNEKVETIIIPDSNICYGTLKRNDKILFITNRNTYEYNYDNNQISKYDFKNQTFINGIQIVGNDVYALKEDQTIIKRNINSIIESQFNSKVHYWTLHSTKKNLWQLSSNGIKLIEYKNLNKSQLFLENFSVSNYTSDSNNHSWVTTLNNGIFNLSSYSIKNFTPTSNAALNSIHAVLVNNDKIFIGNNNGQITILNKKTKELINQIVINENSMLSFRILKLIYSNSKLYACTDIGTFLFDNIFKKPKLITGRLACKDIYIVDPNFLILTNIGFLYLDKNLQDVSSTIINDRFYSFCEYKNQKIFGSENALYYEDEKLKKYQLNQPFNYKIMDLVAVDSLLMAATTEKGVFIIHDHKIIKNINLKTGLNSNNCSKIIPYHGSIFIATNNGISRYNLKNDTYYKIMESDGLASNNVQDLTLYEDTLYAATDNGLSVIPIANLPNKSPFSFFLSPVISQKDTLWDNVTDVNTRSDKFIQLTLNAVSLGVKGAVRYYYRICERDSNFKITLDPSLEINIQEPGVYTFEAYSMDVNDDKSITAIMRIHVVPYWWQTLLFKISCVLAALSVLIIAARILIIRVRKKEQERLALNDRIQKLELDAWKSNINPHFLFNSINTMQSLYSSNQFEMANQFIANFSRVLRKTIDHSDKLMNTISEEIAYLDNYLALEKIKKGNKLFYSLQTTEPEILQYLIPSLLLQPIIENSVKHGIQHSKKGTINVVFSLQNDHIICTVSDNGLGLPENFTINPNSKGLKLVKDKIRIVENVTQKVITFTMANHYSVDGKRNGTITTFVMPVFESRFNIAFTN